MSPACTAECHPLAFSAESEGAAAVIDCEDVPDAVTLQVAPPDCTLGDVSEHQFTAPPLGKQSLHIRDNFVEKLSLTCIILYRCVGPGIGRPAVVRSAPKSLNLYKQYKKTRAYTS